MPELFARGRRLDLELPIVVRGDAAEGGFADSSVTINISSRAVCFESHRRLSIGSSLALEIALPEPLRRHFGGEAVYRTRAVVYRVEATPKPSFRVVARFVRPAAKAPAG